MKKFLLVFVIVLLTCAVIRPKESDITKSRDKYGLDCLGSNNGYVACYEREYPHRIYIEYDNKKFVWYKLRFVYKPYYLPYFDYDGTQSCVDVDTYTTFPISTLPEYDENTEPLSLGLDNMK